ncbi:hypothetical protein [Actinomadura rubrisoli]|uniref:XRE family transcriptional regulator n=1 Tax=Actinomadura rubrisoli TaxID=2530368 RepID=A0A4V2YY53_9ACTN|nr:hypothetical protein [Actinomadura rubrisoli]TDD91847.1 hypothetical protein E1298_11410 [Actinomadura rubrisoli]
MILSAELGPLDEDDVLDVRQHVQHLVALDIRHGGDRASALALRTLKAARQDLRRRGVRKSARRDLEAALAELAEVTAWLLCDANRHPMSLRGNRFALNLARSAGDRSMELFVLHNMSLQATYLRRPERTLDLVRPILDRGGLTPRLTAMFQLRVARAHAQMGLKSDAFKTLDLAKGLLSEGTRDRDPGWAWWVSERGFTHATGAMLGSLGEWRPALSHIQSALSAAPPEARRDRFLYLCILLHAQLESRAWTDMDSTTGELLSLEGTVGSSRPRSRLLATLDQFGRDGRTPRSVRDSIDDIRQAIKRTNAPSRLR